jgi:hypothetical protein
VNTKKMLFSMIWIAVIGCGFKGVEPKSYEQTASSLLSAPGPLKLTKFGKTFVLIDVLELPKTDISFNFSISTKGRVEYPKDFPIFHDTFCTGIGYTIEYREQREAITSEFLLIPFVDGKEAGKEQFSTSKQNLVRIGVYTAFQPVSDFVQNEQLPDEFVKDFRPSGECNMMCDQIRAKPVRRLEGDLCTFWVIPTNERTDDLHFMPLALSHDGQRSDHIKRYQSCNAVSMDTSQGNADLKDYYQQAIEGPCVNMSRVSLHRQFRFVQEKVGIYRPVYSIDNISEIVKVGKNSEDFKIADLTVHSLREWRQ